MFLSSRLPNTKPETVSYNSRAGQYVVKGRFISESDIEALAIVEKNTLSTKLERLTEKLINDVIDIPVWEQEFTNILKKSHIRLTILASGGQSRTGLNSYGIAGRRLKEEYNLLNRFAIALSNGELSANQARQRAKMYAQSTVQTYYEAYYFNKKREGFIKAKRDLDPLANHCKSCLSHVTNGWVDIDQIVPKGAKCECRGNCQCRITYRRF